MGLALARYVVQVEPVASASPESLAGAVGPAIGRYLTGDAVILRPVSSDPQYKPIILRRDFQIFGRVIDVIRVKPKDEMEIVPLYSEYEEPPMQYRFE